jgi:hypothetical protein
MTRSYLGLGIAAGIGAACLLAPCAANAQSAADRSIAQSLFEQAKELMTAGKYAEACPKLEESQRLDPGGGTMLNLALCHESEGRIATAWSDFKEALSLARRDGRYEREQAAQEHLAALQPKLPRVTLSVEGAVAGEQVTVDGGLVHQAAWGLPTPFDPGSHQITVTAQGKKTWQSQFDLAVGEQKTVTIPVLENDAQAGQAPAAQPAAAGAPPADANAEESAKKKRMTGFIVGGVGVVSLGVGAVFGIQALSKRSQSDEQCPNDQCTAEGVALNDEAKTAAWIANIGVGLGLVGIGVGTYLILTAGPKQEAPPASTATRRIWVDANALPNGGRVSVGGVW